MAGDSFSQLRKELLADKPSLRKYMAKKTSRTKNCWTKMSNSIEPERKPRANTIRKLSNDPEGFKSVPPKKVNNEEDVFKHHGRLYKRVQYGSKNDFLVHRGLNPPKQYSKTICTDKLEEMENKRSLLMTATEAKAKEAIKQKNIKGEESIARRYALRNMSTYRGGVVDDLVKQNRAKTSLILKSADRAMTDKHEEMRDFYSHVGSTQVLAMRELQIEDNVHLKDIGVRSGEIFFQDTEDRETGPSEYEEMVERMASELKKNRKIVEVLKTQALEKEMLRNLELEENLESATRFDKLREAELEKRMNEKEAEDKERQKHFDTFTAIADYRDYMRGVGVAEDEAIWQREKDFLEQKEKFNEAYKAKMEKIKVAKQRLVNTVREDLGASYEKQEQEEMEYCYTLQKERDIQLEDQAVQEKLDKKAAIDEMMRAWAKITEANRLVKVQQEMRETEERQQLMKFLELENNVKKAEERKRMVEKDINRMELMYQMNEREKKRQEEADAKAREIKLLRAEGFVREGKIKDRMLERMEDFKNNGLPERFLSNIKQHYHL